MHIMHSKLNFKLQKKEKKYIYIYILTAGSEALRNPTLLIPNGIGQKKKSKKNIEK